MKPASDSLGSQLRRVRRRRGWTLAQVSARCGLAVSTLSKVENDRISLTYHNLAKLAVGLDLDLADFFTAGPIVDRTARRVVCRSGQGRLHETANYAHAYLCAELAGRRMIPVLTRVKARSLAQFGPLIQHPGEEFVFVLKGAVDLHVAADDAVRLRAGDSFYFDGRAGHAAVSAGRSEAVILTVITAPPHGRRRGTAGGRRGRSSGSS